VRQESLFEGFVHSSAGARGLMQIMPATGESIAEQMGWPTGYNNESLYSPYVSVRLGTFYLHSNRRYLDGNLYAALAAYNAGPGNAAIWKNLAGSDPDLLLEIIRFQETRDYIRGIYEIYSTYRSIYSPVLP
jgi:soluble lytic murein transglycosylase